jgi:predicted O-methyltransferase YrrM
MLKTIARDLLSMAVASVPANIITSRDFADRYEAKGWHGVPAHFYHPIPCKAEIARLKRSEMVGVNMPLEPQLALLEELRPYIAEFAGGEYGEMPAADAAILYGMVRHLKPKRIIEIGSGGSTHVSAQAMRKNGFGHITAIDPQPRREIAELLKTAGQWIPEPVESVDLSIYQQLEAGDVLFIDSSHVVRIGGDVTHEFLEIIPRLKPGVIVHIHDIFLPGHYPKKFLDGRMFWTEQYLLHAFLLFNDSWRVLWSAGTVHHDAPDALVSIVPTYNKNADADAGSFWMVRDR